VYACSVGLALACLALAHASIDMIGFLVIGVVLVSAAVASVSVIRRGVHADELALIQGLSQAIARDISLAKSFPRIQELARRLVPRYHAGQLVGLWSVRHSNPGMYHDADADMLALLAPQLALMLAIEGSVQPVVGASDRTSAYIQTLTATTEEIHASSQEVAAAARRASQGAAQAASLVSALARDSEQLTHDAAEVATAGTETRDSGAQMEQTTEKVRLATQTAVRRLT